MNEKTDYSDKIFVKPVYPKEIFKNADRNYYKAYYDFYDYKFDKACNDPDLHLSSCVFNCHRAVEKYLKAFLANNDALTDFNHDIKKINKKCERINENFKEIVKEVTGLSKYGNSDYGYEDIPVNETETINALKAIKKIALFPEIQKLRVQFELPFPSPPKELKDI